MRKRLISGTLSLLILFSLVIPSVALSAPLLSVEAANDTVDVGETFTVDLVIDHNPGFEALQVNVRYDHTFATCVGMSTTEMLTRDDVFCINNPDNSGMATMAVISLASIQGNGTLVQLTFQAKKAGSLVLAPELVAMESNYKVITADVAAQTITITTKEVDTAQPDVPSSDLPAEPAEPEVIVPVSVSFSDVPTTHWAYTYIQNAVANGLFSGVGNGQFGPGMNVTRGMFVTTLYSAAGSPDVELSDFTDIPANAWYAKAVAWASQQGIVSGIGEGKFGPDMPITREQIALILFNYADGVSPGTEIFVQMSYPDAKDIHDWALTAFTWAMNKELITGKSGNVLDPLATATRAEVAVIIQNFVNLTK